MKISSIILSCLILYAGFNYGRFKYILSHADLPEIKQVDRTLGNGTKLKYMAAGDSTAVGQGAGSVAVTYPHGVADYLALTHEVEYKNTAGTGSQTQDVIDKQLPQIISFTPDIITISIGANDVTHWVDNPKIIENYKTIISELSEKTKAKIYITNVPRFDQAYLLPWPLRKYYNSRAQDANTELLTLETDRVKFVDIHKVPVSNSRDQFHPDDQGYTYWTDAFVERIKSNF